MPEAHAYLARPTRLWLRSWAAVYVYGLPSTDQDHLRRHLMLGDDSYPYRWEPTDRERILDHTADVIGRVIRDGKPTRITITIHPAGSESVATVTKES